MTVAAEVDVEGVDARVVKALNHPTRVRILNLMRDRELASPVELSVELSVPLGTVGYHVRRLEQLGFLELARRTQRRGAIEHHYRVRPALAAEASAAPAAASAPADGRGAEAVLVARTAEAALPLGGFDAVEARADRRAVLLDARARRELARALPRWQRAVERIERASARRLARASEPAPRHCVAALMHVDTPGELPDDAA